MVHANPGLRPGLSSAVPTGLDFVMVVLTQGLSHIFVGLFTARLKPCPSFDSLFPSLLGSVKASCAVQIGRLKNLNWTACLSPGIADLRKPPLDLCFLHRTLAA